jgi:hypothetical protein
MLRHMRWSAVDEEELAREDSESLAAPVGSEGLLWVLAGGWAA